MQFRRCPAERLVWLEHYDLNPGNEWNMVTFEKKPPERPFQRPAWTRVSPEMWRALQSSLENGYEGGTAPLSQS